MMATRKTFGLCVLAVVIALVASPPIKDAYGRSMLKVHKKQVMISPPDKDGTVVVRGMPGAIEHTGPAELEIVVQKSNKAQMNSDGSFDTKVAAETGDKIIITARSEVGKKSVGTFKVPAGPIVAGATEKSKAPPSDSGAAVPVTPISKTEAPAAKNNSGLMVIIQVVDKSTMETVTKKTVDIPTDKFADAPDRAKRFARELTKRCAVYLKTRAKKLGGAAENKKSAIEEPK